MKDHVEEKYAEFQQKFKTMEKYFDSDDEKEENEEDK